LGHELGDLALEPVDREGELAQAAQFIARDPHAHRRLGAGEPPTDPRAVELDAVANKPLEAIAPASSRPRARARAGSYRARCQVAVRRSISSSIQ
jgi:hypothetical protein